MKTVLAAAFLFLWVAGTAQKKCPPDLDSVKMMTRADFISLIDTLQDLNFSDKSKRINIPKFITRALNCWKKDKFRIVNPGKPYNNTDAIVRNIPTRQLNYFGVNENFMLLSYNHGGFGSHSHVLIFQYSNNTIKHLWDIQRTAISKEEIIYQLKHIKENEFFHINYIEF
jgi:hypothetical protein